MFARCCIDNDIAASAQYFTLHMQFSKALKRGRFWHAGWSLAPSN